MHATMFADIKGLKHFSIWIMNNEKLFIILKVA